MEQDNNLFANAVKALGASDVEDGAYLGDPATIDAILRSSVADWFDGGDASELRTIPLNVAKELLGHGTCKPVPGWNCPGGIDKWLKAVFNLHDQGTPEETVGSAFLEMIEELTEVFQFASNEDVLPEQWEDEANAIIDRYRFFFMGVDPTTLGLTRDVKPSDLSTFSTFGNLDDGELPAQKKKRGWTKTQEALFKKWRDYP